MLSLTFEHPVHRETRAVGPAPYFRLAGNALRAGPDDAAVAVYEGGAWHVGGKSFLTVTVGEPATIRFEGDGEGCSGTHGPFEQVKLVDGAIRCGPKLRTLLAKFDEDSQSWFIYADQSSCPAAVLSAA